MNTVSICEAIDQDHPTFNNIIDSTHGKSAVEFTNELNELLKLYPRKEIFLSEYSSYGNLNDIIHHLDPAQVLKVEVFDNTKRHDFKTFFGVSIETPAGRLIIQAEWCLWQQMRGYEVVSGLLAPLYLAGLQDKVVFNGDFLCKHGPDHAYDILFQYAKEQNPTQFHPQEENPLEELNNWVEMVKTAQHVNENYSEYSEVSHWISDPIERKVSVFKQKLYAQKLH